MVYLTRRTTFSAAHRLWSNHLTEEENIALYDKCANPNGHGHNYILEVTVRGNPEPHTGMVLNLTDLKQVINEHVIDWVDHKHLNYDVDFLKGVIPTAENLAVAFWRILCPKIAEGRLYSIRVYESEKNYVEYRGE